MRGEWAIICALCVACGGTQRSVPDPPVQTPVSTEEPEAEEPPMPVIDTAILSPVDTAPTDPCDLPDGPRFQIGTGVEQFDPFLEGQAVMLARGNQMPVMHHIFGAIDVYGTPQRVRVHYTLTDVPTEVVVGDHTFYVALAPEPADAAWQCHGQVRGLLGVLDRWEDVLEPAGLPPSTEFPSVFCGTELRISYDLYDEYDALLASASVTVVAQPDRLGNPFDGIEYPPCSEPIR